MSRYIDADIAKENVCKWECGGEPDCPWNKPDAYTHEKCEFMMAIDETQTEDVVPVVRCKDCRFYDPEWKYCQHHRTGNAPEYYCASGRIKG